MASFKAGICCEISISCLHFCALFFAECILTLFVSGAGFVCFLSSVAATIAEIIRHLILMCPGIVCIFAL